MPERFRCLILDLDGTVIDSHAYTFAAFRHAVAPFRDAPTDAEIFDAFGPYERIILRGLLRGDEEVEAAYARLQHYYGAHAGEVLVHPQMRPLLDACRAAGVRCGLFTGRGSESTAMLLRALELEPSFGAVAAGDSVSAPKPSGEGVRRLLHELGCAAEQAIVVGDSRLDREAADDAGVAAAYALWYAWPARALPADSTPRLRDPDAVRPLLALGPPR